jgi:hypothetical protein
MSQSYLALYDIIITARAGVRGIAVFSAGGSGNDALILVTGGLDLVGCVGITASAGIGGITVLGTSRRDHVCDMVMNVILAGNCALRVEGDMILIGITRRIGTPIVFGGIPFKIGGTARIKQKENTIFLCNKSPALVLAVLIQRGIGVSKSKYVTDQRSEGIATIIIHGNDKYLRIGYILKIICGIVNALVIVRAGIHLMSGKKLTVSRRADKNAIAILQLCNKRPSTGRRRSSNVFFAASTLTVNESVAGFGKLVGRVGITASAGISGIAVCGAGGSGHYTLVVMAGGLNLVCRVGITASAGISSIAVCGASGSGHHALVLVAGGLDLVCLVSITASAGISSIAVCGAGGSGNDTLVVMAERFSLCLSALTSSGGGACCFAEYVFVVIFSFASSKAENNDRKYKHKQHNGLEIFHDCSSFLLIVSFAQTPLIILQQTTKVNR